MAHPTRANLGYVAITARITCNEGVILLSLMLRHLERSELSRSAENSLLLKRKCLKVHIVKMLRMWERRIAASGCGEKASD